MALLGPDGLPLALPAQGGMPGADDLTKTIDLYDSEIIAIEKVYERLKERSASPRNYEDFSREIKQRFEEIGLVADVRWYTTNVEGVLMPEVVFTGRTEAKVFDREQMTHEVVNDILETGEGGVINTKGGDPEVMRRLAEGHKH